ncbi:MAG: enoyl-CoA hydratase/isomerase family protein [Xanthobacteraceae bacterium]
MTLPVVFETKDDCLDVILNRPEEGNLITNEMGMEIARTLRAVGTDIKLIRIRGNGADFSKGRQAPKIDRDTMTALDMRHPIAEVPLALYGAVKEARAPTLAIVQGEALGVGCALAAVCDITLAAEDAIFQVPELNHNIAPTLVMWSFLNRVPYKTAAYLVMTRERISAARAEALGLVTKVVPSAGLAAEAETLSQSLLSRRAMALQGIKEFLKFSSSMDAASATAYSSALNATLMASAPRDPH